MSWKELFTTCFPQDELKYVHVAGTNGKGSVIAYLYSALSGAEGRNVSFTVDFQTVRYWTI